MTPDCSAPSLDSDAKQGHLEGAISHSGRCNRTWIGCFYIVLIKIPARTMEGKKYFFGLMMQLMVQLGPLCLGKT